MMERDFISQKTKEYQIKKYLESKLSNVGLSQIKLKKIPLGEKIVISTSRPSLVVGSKGANIKDLTRYLKKEFNLENPQIEINEIKNVFLDPHVVAEKIISSLERFGSARFKSIGHKMMENVMQAGALGVEIILSGKIPSTRAKSWRFYAGYLKKCGDASLTNVHKAIKSVNLKSGTIGIRVSIMPPEVRLPDRIEILETPLEAPPAETEKAKEKESKKKKAPKKKEEAAKEKAEKPKRPKKEVKDKTLAKEENKEDNKKDKIENPPIPEEKKEKEEKTLAEEAAEEVVKELLPAETSPSPPEDSP